MKHLTHLLTLMLLVLLAGCTVPVDTANNAPASGIAEDGTKRFVLNAVFWPNTGYAIESDDAFALTRWGIAETLVRVNFDG